MHARMVFLLCVLLGTAGCERNPDREPLLHLLRALDDSQAKGWVDELAPYEGEEKAVRFFGLCRREEVEILTLFLDRPGSCSPRARVWLEEMHATAADSAALYDALINEGRFVLSDDELARRNGNLARYLHALHKVGAMADWKP